MEAGRDHRVHDVQKNAKGQARGTVRERAILRIASAIQARHPAENVGGIALPSFFSPSPPVSLDSWPRKTRYGTQCASLNRLAYYCILLSFFDAFFRFRLPRKQPLESPQAHITRDWRRQEDHTQDTQPGPCALLVHQTQHMTGNIGQRDQRSTMYLLLEGTGCMGQKLNGNGVFRCVSLAPSCRLCRQPISPSSEEQHSAIPCALAFRKLGYNKPASILPLTM